MTVFEEVSSSFGIVEHIEREAVRLDIPEGMSLVLLTGESFGSQIEMGIYPMIGLMQLEHTESNALLILGIAFDLDVQLVPRLGPVRRMFG